MRNRRPRGPRINHAVMELSAKGLTFEDRANVPLHLNSVTQFAAFSGPSDGLSEGDGSAARERGETRMHLSRHRAIRALAVFLVLALGVAALLPLIARGAFQVNGVISTCGGPTPFFAGTVTLIDANGINPPQTTTSGAGNGVYAFTPPTGRPQLITTNTTNAAGLTNLTLWAAPFLLRASAPDYQTDLSVDVSTQSTATVNLVAGPRLFGHVQNSSGAFLSSGVVAWLYDLSAPNSSA